MSSGEPPDLGMALRRLRRAAGLTQEDLAERAGVSARALSDLERGLHRAPHRDTVLRLAEVLELGEAERATLLSARASRASQLVGDRPLGRQPFGVPARTLAAPLTSFVGRDQELAKVKLLLGNTRLLTLAGPGGVGKTRLALEVGRAAGAEYDDGIALAQLAPLAAATLLPQAVAQALGVRERPGSSLLETLGQQLQSSQVLLILDNCEHLVDACAHLAEALLAVCPRLRVMATSREPLRISGETIWRVPTLPLSDAQHLFAERAQALAPTLSLPPSEDNASDVAEICRRLDGLPLAIELAAAWVAVLAPRQIAARLDDRFRLLVSGTRTAPPRHQRLRSTLDWSYELLDADEQLVFDRLAVFAGGWSLEAAEAVCAGDGLLEPHAVLQFVASLVEKSLVIAEPGAGGTVRYGLLETLRQYAHEHLVERDLVDRARASHAAFFLNVAERLETELEGPRRRPSLDELEREHDNLRAALRWFIDQDKSTEAAQRLGAALGLFWFFQGHLHEGRAWLAQLLAVTTPATRPETRARLLYGTGLLAQFQGDYAAAQPALEECLAIQRDVGDPLQIARSLQLLGQLAWMRSQFDVAGDFLEEALELARTAEDPFLEALIRRGLGDVALAGGDLDTAWTSAEQALALARPAGASTTTCQALRILGEVSHRHGDLPAARSFLEASLETGRQVGEGFWVASILPRLARVALDEGDAAQAAALLEESLGLFHGLGDRVNLARVSAELEQVVAVQRRPGDSAEASRSARPYALTPREREVGTLIARGLSNRQIAAQLVIAEKTAANHVARILDKLDLHSRAALAARAADLGLVAAHS